jgi:hypothetical protein
MKKLLFIFAASVLLFACDNRPAAEAEWELEVSFEEATLDPGSHTLQLKLPQSAKEYAKSQGLDPESISKAEILSAEVMTNGNFDDIEMILLQMASSADMKTLAIAENEEKGKSSLTLKTVEDSDVAEHFKSEEPILVMELNTIDGGETHQFKAKIKFKISSKKL